MRRWERDRCLAPVIAVAVAGGVFVLLGLITRQVGRPEIGIEVEIARVEEAPPLEEMPPLAEDPLADAALSDEPIEIAVESIEVPTVEALLPPVDCSSMIPEIPKPFARETVALIKSPVTMTSLIGSGRTQAGRLAALKRYGGSGAGEGAVIRALRYLKGLQREDGSWRHKGEGDATAFALLAFLAHGETFASAEFGGTVKRALEYLRGHHRSNMAVYALAEAAALIRTPVLCEAAETAVGEMCRRQKAEVKANAGGVVPRYCAVMAMVAAKLARLRVSELEGTMRNFEAGYVAMRDAKAGEWGKIRGEGVWHYMVAAVCLQYLGRGEEERTREMREYLEGVWEGATLGETAVACCPVRSNYFSTMMFFNAGGEEWERWNAGMVAAYAETQEVEGEIGYWHCKDRHIGEQPFWPTVYIVHQLTTYYRYLPTFSEEAWRGKRPEPPPIDFLKGAVIEVEI